MYRVLLLALLAGCSQGEATHADKMNARRQAAHALADQPPKQTVYHLEAGQLIVLDIATVMEGGVADSQKCFIWRDAEYKTASIQCPGGALGDVPDIQ